MIQISHDELMEIRRRFRNFYYTSSKRKVYVEERADILIFLAQYRHKH